GGFRYGQMNAAAVQATTFLLLARACGVRGHEDVMLQALKQQFRFAGRGCVPYGDGHPNPAFIDNGKTGALAFTMAAAAALSPDGEESIYARARDVCASKSFYNTSYLNVGHTGGGIGEVWRGASIGFLRDARPQQYRDILDERRWLMDQSRLHDGSLTIAGGQGYDSGKNQGWCGAVLGLTYTGPRKHLQITGAPRSQYAHTFPLPKRIWGTAADDVFQSPDPIADANGKTFDMNTERFDEDGAAPAMSRMGVPRNAYSHTLPRPKVAPTADTFDHYARHPDFGLRHYAAGRIQANGLTDLTIRYLHHPDPRLRAVGCKAAAGSLTPEMTQPLLRMINDPKESWWVVQAALQALSGASKEDLLPHLDRLIDLAQHEEWWIQNAAVTALGPVADDPKVSRKIFPVLGHVFAANRRHNTLRGPFIALTGKLRTASKDVQQVALANFAEAYTAYPKAGAKREEVAHPTAEEELLGHLAGNMAEIPGGLDTLYKVASKRYPTEVLPHRATFLSKSDYSQDPIAQKALAPTILNELIPEHVGKNRKRLHELADSSIQSERPGGSRDPIDTLAGLYQRAGRTQYGWHMFADLRNAEWSYHSFDPIPAEQVPFDQLITRYREVTLPSGMENWFDPAFDPAGAGWKTGRSPFGNYNDKIPTGALPKCSTTCVGPDCYSGTPVNTLWEKEVLLLRGRFKIPPLKSGHRYRLRVNMGERVGLGGGHIVYVNGKQLIESPKGNGRGGGGVKGAYITKEWLDDFNRGEVTIALKTFIRYNDKYKAKPSSRTPQGVMSIHFDEQKLPPMGDDLVLKSATVVPMLSSAWQAEQDPDDMERSELATQFRYDGNFVSNPQIEGDWKLVAEVTEIGEFDPDRKQRGVRNAPFSTITLEDGGTTTSPTLIWSDDILMDLNKYQALKMQPKTIGDTPYLFVEVGGFNPRHKPGWKSKLYVCKRP
ncbi:MAG: DUF6288 domain-containing protein, partial [Verrucomicrobiota bacterium]